MNVQQPFKLAGVYITHHKQSGALREHMTAPLWASAQDKESSSAMKKIKHVLAIGVAALVAMASAVPLAEAGHGFGGGGFGGHGFGGGGFGGRGFSGGGFGGRGSGALPLDLVVALLLAVLEVAGALRWASWWLCF